MFAGMKNDIRAKKKNYRRLNFCFTFSIFGLLVSYQRIGAHRTREMNDYETITKQLRALNYDF